MGLGLERLIEFEMEDARRLDRGPVDLLGHEEHVGAGVAVEHELALAVGAQRDEGQGGPRAGLEAQRADVDALVAEGIGEEVAEGVVAHLAHEGAFHPQAGEAHGDVGRGPARSPREGRRVDEAGAGDRGHEIDQEVTDAENVGHGRNRSGF